MEWTSPAYQTSGFLQPKNWAKPSYFTGQLKDTPWIRMIPIINQQPSELNFKSNTSHKNSQSIPPKPLEIYMQLIDILPFYQVFFFLQSNFFAPTLRPTKIQVWLGRGKLWVQNAGEQCLKRRCSSCTRFGYRFCCGGSWENPYFIWRSGWNRRCHMSQKTPFQVVFQCFFLVKMISAPNHPKI